MDIREQLEDLRRTVARIDRKYAQPRLSTPAAPVLSFNGRAFVEDLISGEVVETPHGTHFETERLYARGKRHGSYGIADLFDLPPDSLCVLSQGAISHKHPAKWAFLDTETTGIRGGSGPCAFLVGIGSAELDGFRLRQFLMRDLAEEYSLLHAVSSYLEPFDVLVTFNGKSYDAPLLDARFRLRRVRNPFTSMEHLDLLHGARRVFKLRLDDCRLVNLEQQILGVERDGDLPGEMIPYCYFEYLRTQRAWRLAPIFHHNAMDIVTLACLTGLIAEAYRDPASVQFHHGTDLLGIAKWLQFAGRLQEAHAVMRRAVDAGLPDRYLFRALFDCAILERKLGRGPEALTTLTDLTSSPNPFRARAWEELAKCYERQDRNLVMAVECIVAARRIEDSERLQLRQQRLESRIARMSPKRPGKRRSVRSHDKLKAS